MKEATDTMASQHWSPALRVSQLDALELDEAAFEIAKGQLGKVFKYMQLGFLSRFEPEVEALLKYLLWHFTVGQQGATLGQHMLRLQYIERNRKALVDNSSRRQYAALAIALPWLQQRSGSLLQTLGLQKHQEQLLKWLGWMETAVRVASLANFLVFLRSGGQAQLIERVLGLQAAFPQRQSLRQVSFEFMTREMLWHGFSEFLYFAIPIINFPRIKNQLQRWLSAGGGEAGEGEMGGSAARACALCGDPPIQPHSVGCVHAFCFYCVMSNWAADPGFSCPKCQHRVLDSSSICPLKRLLHTKSS